MPAFPKPAPTASQRGKASKRKGAGGERELTTILPDCERVPLSGELGGKYSGDVTFCNGEYRAEVKRRAGGFALIYRWLRMLPGYGVNTIKRTIGVERGREKAPDFLFVRADNSPWLAVCALDTLLAVLTERENLRARVREEEQK